MNNTSNQWFNNNKSMFKPVSLIYVGIIKQLVFLYDLQFIFQLQREHIEHSDLNKTGSWLLVESFSSYIAELERWFSDFNLRLDSDKGYYRLSNHFYTNISIFLQLKLILNKLRKEMCLEYIIRYRVSPYILFIK